ncbi:hypothetical protein SCLCIDRAFT_1219256 [Scleroderma citrinum Foug A]|uniref:L-lysine 6-oxidase n=1 Tax=Scleroderma citrinum Foug A TaxID=1036808 RepID=A0A0C2ZYT2_9AGAM|nr:hypothetical protein SCLCIDRAFT_1219256 [Scleroderma citrinum Foug A]
MSIPYPQISYIKIFPPIGVARLGDSGFNLDTGKPDGDIKWFLPSDLPGTENMPDSLNGRFRDDNNRIKRQAVRFRVYAYDQNGANLGEITSGKGSPCVLKWTVHVANHKAAYNEFHGEYKSKKGLRNPDVQGDMPPEKRTKLQIDAGEQVISNGRGSDRSAPPINLAGDFYGSQTDPTKVHLGQMLTDEKGRLIFIGGAGYSRCVGKPGTLHFQPDITSEFDSIDWVDDTCDGWVNVDLQIDYSNFHQTISAMNKSTVLSAPPKFAWGINPPTTLFDLLENIYNYWADHPGTDFYLDIWPVLRSTYALSWVNKDAYEGHGVAGKGNFLTMEDQLKSKAEDSRLLREHVFNRLRLPDYEDPSQANTMYMPRLSGNNGDAIEPGENLKPNEDAPPIKRFAALTKVQYERFKAWKDGNFDVTIPPWRKYDSFESVPEEYQPTFLTRAALEHTIGEPLYPGLEMYWLARLPEVYIRNQYSRDNDPPFRINHDKYPAGHLGRGLSLPWQSDFDLCNTHWWPSGRPDDVINIKFVTEQASTSVISEKDYIDSIAPKRKKWTRGLRETPLYPSEYYPGSTDMVRHWQKLGFVAKDPRFVIGDSKLPIWVENERMHVPEETLRRNEFTL